MINGTVKELALNNSYTKLTWVTLSILMSNLTVFPDQPSMDYNDILCVSDYCLVTLYHEVSLLHAWGTRTDNFFKYTLPSVAVKRKFEAALNSLL